MDLIPNKTPNSIKLLFPNYTWDFYDRKEKKIYLTFDDGPIPEVTDFVLDQLNLYDAKATFFCIGENIQKNPEIFNRIVLEDHSIGNHTMNHLKARKNSLTEYVDNVLKCENEILEHTKINNKFFRPPYGQLSKPKLSELRKLKYQIILWDVLSKDWDKSTSPEQCTDIVINNSKKGSIIVFHDSIKAFRNLKIALPKVLKHFSQKGFVFEKI
ncbi:Peptidoglycan/xylan/chitin deacetylase, PgdA/CDA1 family [Aquimarina amphilecti]|uniref:Peptidoglycan/xylan/chitin deacetylase, PgdA/CDA1 family n=1 Tax=Aquimarina amphilecti TaxID=1038014 RepID=A0A1H7NAX4_AQUAM|nr:polysaccharide deacetylase family protein [Aquimarina amphilecti]SEL20732.1 Peptidoglycan/xylan/chitin deacetylase, PgdA/CDA1 family [Aquimarina amphilecti]